LPEAISERIVGVMEAVGRWGGSLIIAVSKTFPYTADTNAIGEYYTF
jgi:hypothetical protein